MLPITAELHIKDLDVLNFVCYWDPRSYDGLTAPSESNAVFRRRVTCENATLKKDLLERI